MGTSSDAGRARQPTNPALADLLDRIADLLEAQHRDGDTAERPYKVRAYRRAAQSVRRHPDSIAEIVARGDERALESVPGIGKSIAATLREVVQHGRSAYLERLQGSVSPADLFASVPGVGDALAHRIESELHLETLEDLEAAAVDGRLERVPGFGPRRVRGVRDALASRLRWSGQRRASAGHGSASAPATFTGADDTSSAGTSPERPSVALLLELDAEYRDAVARDALRRIAPRRFNPERRAWLPILHVDRQGWSFTLLFSNTARAHELGRTRDWVVIYYERDGVEDQCTVVTEHGGPLDGQRVVRGRESEPRERTAQGRESEPRERTAQGRHSEPRERRPAAAGEQGKSERGS